MMSQVVFLSHAILFCKYLWTENMAPKHKETGTDVREMIVKCHREGKIRVKWPEYLTYLDQLFKVHVF